MIEYNIIKYIEPHIEVYLDGKKTGTIRPVLGGFAYFPKGHKTGGETFETLEECKQSLEED